MIKVTFDIGPALEMNRKDDEYVLRAATITIHYVVFGRVNAGSMEAHLPEDVTAIVGAMLRSAE